MDEAIHCDRLAILHQGTVLADDSPRNLLWNGRTRIRIRHKEGVDELEVANYPEQLPAILQRHGLDPAIDRIEIEEATLETVVLRMIADRPERDTRGI